MFLRFCVDIYKSSRVLYCARFVPLARFPLTILPYLHTKSYAAALFDNIILNLETAQRDMGQWTCDLGLGKMEGPKQDSQRLHASQCFVEQTGFSMPAGALGGRVGDFSCGLTSYCMEDILSTEPAILCMNCKQEKNAANLFRGFACELASKQCVCGQRNMPATMCTTSEDCGLTDSICNMKTSFYSSSYSTQQCADSTGQSYCMKQFMHENIGTCTSYVNDAINLVPTCFQESLQVSKWQYDEQMCVGYAPDLGSIRGGILMSDTFMFPCTDISSFGQDYKLACVRIVLDGTIQNSILSYLTFNIQNTPSFGRRLLSNSSTDSVFGHDTSMLSVFIQQSAVRIPQIEGRCRKILQLCVQDPEIDNAGHSVHNLSDGTLDLCKHCARMWWMANYTLTMSAEDHDFMELQFYIRDTELLDIRNVVLRLSHASVLIPHMLKRTPHAISLLLHDWLQDDTAYEFIMRCSRVPMQLIDNFVYFFMHNIGRYGAPLAVRRNRVIDRVEPPQIHGTHTRRLLQDSTNVDNSVTNSLSRSRDSAVRQLRDKVTFFDVSSFEQIFDDIAERNKNLENEVTNIRLQTFGDAFDSLDGTSCMLSFGTVQNDIIMNFARVLAKDGWTVKPVCTRKQMLEFAQTIPECPIVTLPFTRMYDNTMTLAKYYAHMTQSGCLTNMSIPCLAPAVFVETGILNALPKLSSDPKFTNLTMQDISEEKDILSLYLLKFFYVMTDFITFDRTAMMSGVVAFASTDALYDEDVYDVMVRNNEYSIGRLMKDYFSCSLQQTIACDQKNLSLLPVFGAVVIVIGTLHLILPVPAVISFFLWTLGLTWGVVYMSYNFSPLCSPRIPTCLGAGLYELSEQLLPLHIEIPVTLYHSDKCNADLTLKPEFAKLIPNFACGKTCLDTPYQMNDIITVLIAVETWVRYDHATFVHYLITQFDFVLPRHMNQEYLAIIQKYATAIRENSDGYVLGFIVCIFFNFYKLIAFFIILTVFLPFCFNLVFSLLTFIGVLILKYSFFAYGTDIYSNMN